ncbi:MAG: hypothetical protein J5762_02120 [Clostridia bacterium]|nr:hypothetical protein [Clostridia bacterium]
MKHKRLLIILSAAVATAFAVLVFVALFSVKDVVVHYSVYGERVTAAEEVLSQFKGKNLLFVDENEVADLISEKLALKVDGVKKVYPAGIEVSVSRCRERYAFYRDGAYYIADEQFAVVDKRDDSSNSGDGLGNIIVETDINEELSLEVLTRLDYVNDPYIRALKQTVEPFSDPRDVISRILIYETAEKGNVRITLSLRTGVEIVVYKAFERTGEKVSAAIEKLSTLSDGDKLVGKIECLEREDKTVYAVYTVR